MTDQNDLPPAQPPDPKGTRPPLDLGVVVAQIQTIQTKLARERAEKKAREKV